ncbi:hypothetical protein [Umezawaea sp. Da 62-37]|uniref:hypothetical protein n=1 Tax=Umezawaea sp. Da 62-37 TaxID=3075927 RepID=UPI0028F6D876|nr:hypothetical protein [Umezawaea sp. Da 62-37]WNV84723.1 hypothetical protein RM788_42265 [Umezawaea sp. Da 62-37]
MTDHDISVPDAKLLWTVRNALLHGYFVPKPSGDEPRRVQFNNFTTGYALDTRDPKEIQLSVPVFCGHLVERIAAAVPERWDMSLIDVDEDLAYISVRHLPPLPLPRDRPRPNRSRTAPEDDRGSSVIRVVRCAQDRNVRTSPRRPCSPGTPPRST